MRIEIPDFARCCACLPLRFGILTFGYIKMGLIIYHLAMQIRHSVVHAKDYRTAEILQRATVHMYRGFGFISQFWFILILICLETAFNVVLLVGAHLKRTNLIRAYYYYGITTTVATFVAYVVVWQNPLGMIFGVAYVVEFCTAFTGLVMQVYLLFLIRSELKKLENKTQNMRFVNHSCEVYADQNYTEEGPNPL